MSVCDRSWYILAVVMEGERMIIYFEQTISTVACILLLACAGSAEAQDPVKASPNLCVVPLENEKVRLFESRLQPGQVLPMHSHPQYVAYALTTATLQFTAPDGNQRQLTVPRGMAVWREPETHEVKNVGVSEARILHFELKREDEPTTFAVSGRG